MPLATDALLAGRYRIDTLLDTGGMADVYAAVDTRLDRHVAVKMLRTADEALAGRLDRERRILARLVHPAIVHIYDADEHDGVPFLVMELVDGTSLAAELRSGPLDESRVARIGADLADALAHAHRLGITHRDVKP